MSSEHNLESIDNLVSDMYKEARLGGADPGWGAGHRAAAEKLENFVSQNKLPVTADLVKPGQLCHFDDAVHEWDGHVWKRLARETEVVAYSREISRLQAELAARDLRIEALLGDLEDDRGAAVAEQTAREVELQERLARAVLYRNEQSERADKAVAALAVVQADLEIVSRRVDALTEILHDRVGRDPGRARAAHTVRTIAASRSAGRVSDPEPCIVDAAVDAALAATVPEPSPVITGEAAIAAALTEAERRGQRVRITWHPDSVEVADLEACAATPEWEAVEGVPIAIRDGWRLRSDRDGWWFIVGEPDDGVPSIIAVELLDAPPAPAWERKPVTDEWGWCNRWTDVRAVRGWKVGDAVQVDGDRVVALSRPLAKSEGDS